MPEHMDIHAYMSEYKEALFLKGWRYYSRGHYSTVLTNSKSNNVIKVGYGDNWPEYIEESYHAGFLGNIAPRVYQINYKKQGFYVAIMEKLNYVDRSKVEGFHDIVDLFYDMSYRFDEPDRYTKAIIKLTDKFGKNYIHLLMNLKGKLDIHNDNFMMRANGELVIIDPVHLGVFDTSRTGTKSRF